jgi:phospholipase/carboxylesterase
MELLYTAHVPAGDGPFATVLALHGWGASAHDLLGLAPLLRDGQALVLCPQGSARTPIGPNMVGYGWYPIGRGASPDAAAFTAAASSLRDFLDRASARYPIDPAKVVLLGFSQGGVMAYDFFLREPERFAGLAALSSWLPEEIAERHRPGPAHEKRPVLVMHGERDPMIDVERARSSRDRLLRFGLSVRYREFEMGHEISPEALRELRSWLDQAALPRIYLA